MSRTRLTSATGPDRRLFLQALLGTGAALGLSACTSAAASGPTLAGTAALPTAVPAGTSLSIASSLGAEQLQLQPRLFSGVMSVVGSAA